MRLPVEVGPKAVRVGRFFVWPGRRDGATIAAMSLLLGLSLLLAPVEAPEATNVWAEAGGRPWTVCRDHERQAEAVLLRLSQRADENLGETPWAKRAIDCPGAPAVLVVAALRELRKIPAYPSLAELKAVLPRLAEGQRQARLQAQKWLLQASMESERRGEAPPLLTHFFAAQAALGLGDPVAARQALARAGARGEVEEWRLELAGALAALLAGELQTALELAFRARELSPSDERHLVVYMLALVYDRAGAPEAAGRQLAALGVTRFGHERVSVDVMLPFHERLYLSALEDQAKRNPNNARLLWEAYLACPEPEEPERRLVERRLKELAPRGSVVPTFPGNVDRSHLLIMTPSGPQLHL
jgi:hypothetical protein